jgi:GT2 family glycosyltransferase
VVVDNGSHDRSLEILQQYKGIEVIQLDRNYGFAGGVNRGIRWAIDQNRDYVALFNNDAVAELDWLEQLVRTAEAYPDVGLATGKFLKIGNGDTLDSTGEFYSVWGMGFPRGRDEVDVGQYDGIEHQIVFGGTGGASLYRVEALLEVGLFDEEFFAYAEDLDISFRLQLGNWRVRYCSAARAYHHVGGTSRKLRSFTRYHSVKNNYYVYMKNMPGWLFWKYLSKFLAGMMLVTANCWLQRQFLTWLRAVGRVLVTMPRTLSKRRRIQRDRKASLDYINSILYGFIPPVHKHLGKKSPPPALPNC